MGRWHYPFKTKAEADRYRKQAKEETGLDHRVFRIDYQVRIYKIFRSKEECLKYLKSKHNKFLKPIAKVTK